MTDQSNRSDQELDGLLGAIPPEERPPAELHAQVVARLVAEGLLRPSRAAWVTPAPWVAALAAVILGFVAGRTTAPSPPEGAPRAPAVASAAEGTGAALRYALLLYVDGRFAAGGRTAEEVASLYRRWAEDVDGRGDLVLAEELADTAVVVGGAGEGAPVAAPRGGGRRGSSS